MSGKVAIHTGTAAGGLQQPALRYAFGATMIMGLSTAFGGPLAYIVPVLALSFLSPGNTAPTLASATAFLLLVIVTTTAGLFFVKYFFGYPLLFLLLLAMILFWIFYNQRIHFATKLFLLLSFLAMPVPTAGMQITTWAYILKQTLVYGALFTIVMILTVFTLFPDRQSGSAGAARQSAPPPPSSSGQFTKALEVFIVTFPAVLAFLFFRWSNALLVLLYIVVLSMLPSGKKAGIAKLLGNLLGGVVTLVFFQLIVTVPLYSFFLLLYLGTALVFASKIYPNRPASTLYRTAFSTITLIIGSAVLGGENATTEISARVLQVFASVLYVVVAFALLDTLKKHMNWLKNKFSRNSRTEAVKP